MSLSKHDLTLFALLYFDVCTIAANGFLVGVVTIAPNDRKLDNVAVSDNMLPNLQQNISGAAGFL